MNDIIPESAKRAHGVRHVLENRQQSSFWRALSPRPQKNAPRLPKMHLKGDGKKRRAVSVSSPSVRMRRAVLHGSPNLTLAPRGK